MASIAPPSSLPLAALRHAGRELALPLDIILPDGRVLQLESLLRVLPGKRYVGRASFAGEHVLAKLLVGKKAVKRFAAEKKGALLLAEQSLPTPRLLDSGLSAKEGWLLFQYLPETKTLAEMLTGLADGDCLPPPLTGGSAHGNYEDENCLPSPLSGEGGAKRRERGWREAPIERERKPLPLSITLLHAATAIAQLHRQGLWQQDLHPGNLLYDDEQVFWIDGDGIRAEQPGRPLSPQQARDNFAMFLAQLPLCHVVPENALTALFAAYHTANPESTQGWLPSKLSKAVARQRAERLRDWLGKIKRNCSSFIRRQKGWRGAFGLTMVRREEAETLKPLLNNPDAFIERGEIYKDKGAATVAKVNLNGRQLVIKRCNIKSFSHRLWRCWRESRAWVSWREANRMLALGMETAKPLAVIEERHFWLRGRAWLIMEHVEGANALTHLKSPAQQQEIEAMRTLLAELKAAGLSHGDMKGTNLIWRAEVGRWALLDLDAMRAHRCPICQKRAQERDLARLLRNWPEDGLRQTLAREWGYSISQ